MGIVWNNSLVGGHGQAAVWTAAREHITLCCIWHLSAWPLGYMGRSMVGPVLWVSLIADHSATWEVHGWASALSCCYCFDTVGWMTGRHPARKSNLCHLSPKLLFWNTCTKPNRIQLTHVTWKTGGSYHCWLMLICHTVTSKHLYILSSMMEFCGFYCVLLKFGWTKVFLYLLDSVL